jgi:HK97 gp10 family phage protein
MPSNVSLERFRRLTEELKQEVHREAVAELNRQAQELAKTISNVAPVYQGRSEPGVTPGALKGSVRVIADRSRDTVVRVVAGGQLTIRPAVSSKPYDYARADEFGTVKMRAKPFFFPTYRLMKSKIIGAMKRKVAASIKKYSAERG